MGSLIVSEFVTLDGVMEAPGGEPGHPHTGWVIPHMSEEMLNWKLAEIRESAHLLVGRVTYESFAGAWPQRSGPMADKLNAMPKHVVSRSLRDPTWNNAAVIAGDVAAEVRRLCAQSRGPVMVHGSRTLVHFLLTHDLVDELRLLVFPASIGSGGRLFPDTDRKMVMSLAETRTFPSDVVLQVWRPVRG